MRKTKRDYEAMFAALGLPLPKEKKGKRKYKRKFKDPVWLLMGGGERAIEMVRLFAESAKCEEQVTGLRGRPRAIGLNVFVKDVVPYLHRKFPRLGVSKNAETKTPEIKNPATGRLEPVPAIVAEGLRRAGYRWVTEKAVARRRERILGYEKRKRLH